MSTETQPKKRGKLKKIMLPAIAVLALGGIFGTGGFFVANAMGGDAAEEKPDLPKLILKDGGEVDAPASGKIANKSDYRVTYHKVEQSFTSNLLNDSGFAQVELAVSTYYDESVLQALTDHDFAIRNAIVLELADTDAIDLATIAGKKDLAERLRNRINATLEQKIGFGGIDEVYFTKLVLQ